MIPKPSNQRGFTLIELLVAVGLSTVVIGLVVATLISQQKNHMTQDALVDMQQGIRAAMEVMGGDMQMAGYDPTGSAGARFLIADRSELQFQLDRNGDGRPRSPACHWLPGHGGFPDHDDRR